MGRIDWGAFLGGVLWGWAEREPPARLVVHAYPRRTAAARPRFHGRRGGWRGRRARQGAA